MFLKLTTLLNLMTAMKARLKLNYHSFKNNCSIILTISQGNYIIAEELNFLLLTICFIIIMVNLILLWSKRLFSRDPTYFGALIFPLSRSTVGVISNFSLPAAATSVNSLQEEFYRPKYLPVASAEHSQLFWNHFNFITPMIDNEVLFFVTPAVATHSFHSGDTFFPHWYFLFLRSWVGAWFADLAVLF
jgi:hypothetical protein